MKQSIFHRVSGLLWGAIVVLIVLLAVYVSVGRMLSSLTGSFQSEILLELNHRVPFTIAADRVSAQWQSFTPILVLDGLRITLPGERERSLELSEGRIALDVAGSLLTGTPQMTQLDLKGLDLGGELGADGRLRLRGLNAGDEPLGDWLEDFLLNFERVVLGDARLVLLLPGGEERGFDFDLTLSREGSHRRLEGSLQSSRGLKIFALGEGVGNPFKPETFTGQLYFDVDAVDLGAIGDLLPDSLRPVRIDGGIGLELWSSWNQGKSTTSLRLGMDDVVFAARDSSWRLPLDWIALEASLEDQSGGWALSVAALELARGKARLRVPRLQLDIRGETVQLRAQELPLAPLGSLLAGVDLLPPAATDVLRALQPRGKLAALEVSVGDFTAPLEDWQLRANFEQLAVDPWQGAPGVTGARGYVEIAPGSGFVILDSPQFSMTFPTVYKAPLRYDDFHGTIHIGWDSEAVVLSSGLVEAHGEEGRVPVLFGLTIPLVRSAVGLEMDLLVGLENTHPGQRGKYIPYILDEGLRSWLKQSIGDGVIEQGGFLWRGSLDTGSPALHTVQLFFNIRDTALRYQPDWPALAAVDGTVLIDDSSVSVWAGTASLLSSAVRDLSVEVWVDRAAELWLAVAGSVAGPAADGLAIFNDSPLRDLVGDQLTDWQLRGNLATELTLLLNLGERPVPPRIGVSVRFDTVDLDILPGSLPLRGITGVLDYDTTAGFSSRDLAGQLWGNPLQASVRRRDTAGMDSSAVVVELASTVDTGAVQQWLAPDLPAFAQGQAGVTARFVAGAGEPPVLTIDSTLDGVSLDLPEPWNKPAGELRPLHLELFPAAESLRVDIALADELSARLELANGQLRAGALALAGEPVDLEPGIVRVSGRAAYADVSQWQRFVTTYSMPDPSPPGAAGQTPPPAIVIDNLQVDRLVAGGQDMGPVALSLAEEDGHWRLAADTDWLRGELLYSADGESRLDLGYLDLAGLDRVKQDRSPAGDAHIFKVPDMAVTIAELRQAETPLGALAFDLRSEGADIYAQNIIGHILAMELRAREPARVIWRRGANSQTTVAARLYFEDLGRTLAELGYQEIIETEQGNFNLALEWAGGPQDFSLQDSTGSLRGDIGAGHFPDAPGGASGALRVVSILNLAEIVQRLSLANMFESGIPFNKVDGELLLQGGTIAVDELEVESGASSFQFSGVTAVESRTLEGELVVTLPVANNLPWVVALTAGLPVAAGVFLLSKVFETPLNRLTSAVYSVTGSWDDPQVEFDRVFDDTAAGAQGGTPLVVPRVPAAAQPDSP